MPSNIEWTDETWNPVTGCSKVSPGCKYCYAETIAKRFWKDRKFTDVRTHADRLDAPLRWRKPRRVFVNSMSDLFHEDVPDEFIDRVFAVMALCPQHTFQVLTKRAERMARYFNERIPDESEPDRFGPYRRVDLVSTQYSALLEHDSAMMIREWPLPNVWLGVSAEDQQRADERIPWLLKTPAAVRFVSAEPLLGPIDFRELGNTTVGITRPDGSKRPLLRYDALAGHEDPPYESWGNLDWVIVGGESGSGARPCDVAWIRSIVDQCKAASVPVFVKQLGSMAYEMPNRLKLKHSKGGDHAEWSEDLRVRQFPEVPHA